MSKFRRADNVAFAIRTIAAINETKKMLARTFVCIVVFSVMFFLALFFVRRLFPMALLALNFM